MMRTPQVFLSHTSELSRYPRGRSFIRAAEEALIASGTQVLEMSYFPAAAEDPAQHCRRQLARADVLVAIIGFRYGSRIFGDGLSYTEMEFRQATDTGLPRLAFLLADDAEVPVGEFADFQYSSLQISFRESILSANDITVKFFRTPDELKAQLLQSLVAFDEASNRNSAVTAPRRRPWMVPNLTGSEVSRPDLFDRAVSILSQDSIPHHQNSLVLEGPGGFGKTTLAKQICHDRSIKARFPGGTLWIVVGQQLTEADLATRIGLLAAELGGQAVPSTDPLLAGSRLGQLLDDREPTLLVIDDIWDRNQLRPFQIGGAACQRLITSRIRRLATGGHDITVDRMTAAQARAVLTSDRSDSAPALTDRLLAQTGRWPVLLGLVSAAIREHIRRGASNAQATEYVTARLRDSGPTSFDQDTSDARWREYAVAATVKATLDLLNDTEIQAYNLLSIFPEDVEIPPSILSMIWKPLGKRSDEIEKLADEMARLSLINEGWRSGQLVFQLHDVIRDLLRRTQTREQLNAANLRFIRDASARLAAPRPSGDFTEDWWNLPRSEGLLWRHLAYHYREAGQMEDLQRLVTDPRWVLAKLEQAQLGPGSIDDDLATAEFSEGEQLRSALDKNAHLLAPTEPTWALGDILLSRLPPDSTWAARLQSYLRSRNSPTLIALWPPPDIASDALLRIVSKSDTTLRACAYSPDGAALYVGGDNRIVSKILVPGRLVAQTFIGHAGAIWACAVSPDGSLLVTAADDSTLRVWNTDSGETMHVLTGHQGAVNDVAFAPDGQWIASASNDSTIRIWETQNFRQMNVLEGHVGAVRCIAVLPDATIISGGNDRLLHHWNVESGQQVRAYSGHQDWIWGCASSPDGTWVAAVGDDRTVRLWEVGTGLPRGTLVGHQGPVNDCSITADGSFLISVSDDRTVKVWDSVLHRATKDFRGHSDRIRHMSLSATGQELSTVSNDGTARIWNLEALGAEHPLDPSGSLAGTESGWLYSCVLSPDGKSLAAGTGDGRVVLYDTSDGQPIRSFARHEGIVRSCHYSASEPDLVLSAGDDGYARLWRSSSGEVVHSLNHGAAVNSSRSVAGLNMIITSGDDHVSKVWDLTSGMLRAELIGHTDAVWDTAISPDGSTLATSSDDLTLRVWDAHEFREFAVLQGHHGGVNCCAYSPTAPVLASGSDDGTLRVWDLATGRTTSILAGHSGPVVDCTFSPDGTKLISAGNDRTVVLWETDTWSRVGMMRAEWPLSACAWAGEGSLYFIAGPFFYGFKYSQVTGHS